MTDWHSVELRSVVDQTRGISYGIVQPGSFTADGIPIVRVSDVRNGRIQTDDPLRVSATVEATYSRTRLQGGELLITIVGTVGETAIVPATMAGWNVARAIAVLPVQADVGAYWIQLALRSAAAKSMIQSRLNTTVQATLNLGDLARLPMLMPPPSERSRIVAILHALDDKIDLNRRMNETLEAIARAIFKDWFVDFGPTRAKVARCAPYLSPEIWALFPDRLDGVEKPEGWPITSLANYAVLNPEAWSRTTFPDVLEYVDLSGTKWGIIETTEMHTRETAPSRAQRILRSGDTIVGTVRPGNGSFTLVGRHGLTGSTGFAVLRPIVAIGREFVYLAATQPENIERLSHLADGGAYPAIRPDVVLGTQVVKCSERVLHAFSNSVQLLINRINANLTENVSLSTIRDLLLPRLMSGELNVRDAARVVEAV